MQYYMFFLKNISLRNITYSLMIFIIAISFILFGSSKGGGGKGGNGGGSEGDCNAVRPSTLSLIFPTNVPGRRSDSTCVTLPISLGNPTLDYGAQSIYNPNLYYCKITIRGTCPNFIREYVWKVPQQSISIEVPTQQPYTILVNY
ncbi:MAG: hypothetical protein EAY69_00640 [Cytophagales bacterium]|nr:MAG: hypothetical protein EAY69_00640 [Cytophagales bacterium]